MSYFWQHPLDMMNLEQIKGQEMSPNLPSLDNQGMCGRFIGEEVSNQFDFTGTQLEGARLFNEQFDPSYQPPEEIILMYAKYLGINIQNPEEEELIQMAYEGLMMPFEEENWKILVLGDGESPIMYFNTIDQEIIQEHPIDQMLKQSIAEQKSKLGIKESGKDQQKDVKSKKPRKESNDKNVKKEEIVQNEGQKGEQKEENQINEEAKKSTKKEEKKEEKNQDPLNVAISDQQDIQKQENNLEDQQSLIELLKQRSLQKQFKNKGRVFGQEYEGIIEVLPPMLQEQFIGKGVKFFEEKMNYSYKPSSKRIKLYAQFLGADPKKFSGVKILAIQGLKQQLTPDWFVAQTQDNEIFYINNQTWFMQLEHPVDQEYKIKVQKYKERSIRKSKRLKGSNKS